MTQFPVVNLGVTDLKRLLMYCCRRGRMVFLAFFVLATQCVMWSAHEVSRRQQHQRQDVLGFVASFRLFEWRADEDSDDDTQQSTHQRL